MARSSSSKQVVPTVQLIVVGISQKIVSGSIKTGNSKNSLEQCGLLNLSEQCSLLKLALIIN